MRTTEINVNGTLIWYYFICPREVWLMARQINPDEDNSNVDLGRFIHEHSYQRDKKEINLGNIKLDILKKDQGELVVAEVKKSSKFELSARMQLAFYLIELEKLGIKARGELCFPQEKRRQELILDDGLRQELERAVRDLLRIAYLNHPPKPARISFCRNCAYAEFCWS